MSELIVIIYENKTGAKTLEAQLVEAQENQNLSVSDTALILRQDDGRPVLSHAVDLVGRGSMGSFPCFPRIRSTQKHTNRFVDRFL
ncbi:MAG: hypothetical protein IMY85_05770 [Chloroflexi bacterium]|nr:hypothetical protein [Chloroflexota bacterium]